MASCSTPTWSTTACRVSIILPKDFETILVESHNGPGPFGAKGTGEGGLLPVAAAIGNAVYRATGLRLYDLPLTPEKVWRGLASRNEVND